MSWLIGLIAGGSLLAGWLGSSSYKNGRYGAAK